MEQKTHERTADGRIIHRLHKPITLGDETITELHIREVEAGDLRGLPDEGRTFGHRLDVMGKVAGQPPAVMNKLSVKDLEGVSALVEGF